MNKEDLNWFTGFFEGEGDVSCFLFHMKDSKSGKRYPCRILRAGITQTNIKPLKILQKEFKGSIIKKQLSPISKLDCYHWQVSCQLAKKFLLKILPFIRMTNKKVKILKALKYYKR